MIPAESFLAAQKAAQENRIENFVELADGFDDATARKLFKEISLPGADTYAAVAALMELKGAACLDVDSVVNTVRANDRQMFDIVLPHLTPSLAGSILRYSVVDHYSGWSFDHPFITDLFTKADADGRDYASAQAEKRKDTVLAEKFHAAALQASQLKNVAPVPSQKALSPKPGR